MVKAISLLKKQGYFLEYQLVGGGNSDYLSSIARAENVNNEVIFLGKMKHEDIFSWLSEIDIYIQPSDAEGLPRSVIEAMSMGCPIIGSNAGGIPELIDKSVVFEKGNIDELCDIIKSFSVEKMKEQAIINHKNAQNYTKTILYRRREEFFREFITNEIEGKKNA